MYQADPAADGQRVPESDLVDGELGELQPLTTFSAEVDRCAFAAART